MNSVNLVRKHLSSALGWLVTLPDPHLRPFRRRRIERSIRNELPIDSITFVCRGNVCRSAYAEGSLRRKLERTNLAHAPDVSSLGFLGPGRRPPAQAISEAGQRGVDLSLHRSRTLEDRVLRRTDLVFVMTADHQRRLRWLLGRPDAHHLGDLDPLVAAPRDIHDPVNQPDDAFDRVFDQIDRCLDALLPLLASGALSDGA